MLDVYLGLVPVLDGTLWPWWTLGHRHDGTIHGYGIVQWIPGTTWLRAGVRVLRALRMSHLSPVSLFHPCTLVFLVLFVCVVLCLFVWLVFVCLSLECLDTVFVYILQQLDDRPCFIARSATRKKKGRVSSSVSDRRGWYNTGRNREAISLARYVATLTVSVLAKELICLRHFDGSE